MGGRFDGLRLFKALPALAAFAVGCELLMDGQLDRVLCSAEGTLGPPACPEGQACNAGACVTIESLEGRLGFPCTSDHDCGAQDFCFDPGALGGQGRRTCSRPCCTSSDCDPVTAAVCWVPDGGSGGFCRLGADVDVGRPEVGAHLAGMPCSRDGDCRSGRCRAALCLDSCCSDTNCAAAGAACRLSTATPSTGASWTCQPVDPTTRGDFEACRVDADCSSGICASLGVGRRCTIPCCSSETCPLAWPAGGVSNVGCGVLNQEGFRVRACAELRPVGAIQHVGVSCEADAECRGGMCVRDLGASTGFCSDICCTDADCGDASLFECRPYAAGSPWALRCAPK
jgi:hypothetical protein